MDEQFSDQSRQATQPSQQTSKESQREQPWTHVVFAGRKKGECSSKAVAQWCQLLERQHCVSTNIVGGETMDEYDVRNEMQGDLHVWWLLRRLTPLSKEEAERQQLPLAEDATSWPPLERYSNALIKLTAEQCPNLTCTWIVEAAGETVNQVVQDLDQLHTIYRLRNFSIITPTASTTKSDFRRSQFARLSDNLEFVDTSTFSTMTWSSLAAEPARSSDHGPHVATTIGSGDEPMTIHEHNYDEPMAIDEHNDDEPTAIDEHNDDGETTVTESPSESVNGTQVATAGVHEDAPAVVNDQSSSMLGDWSEHLSDAEDKTSIASDDVPVLATGGNRDGLKVVVSPYELDSDSGDEL